MAACWYNKTLFGNTEQVARPEKTRPGPPAAQGDAFNEQAIAAPRPATALRQGRRNMPRSSTDARNQILRPTAGSRIGRRSFLKTSAAITGGAFVASRL